jgi:hypothetical protein
MTTTTKKKTTTTKAVSLELPKNPFVFEVLDLVSKQRSKAKKIEVLKMYEHVSLKAVLIWNFDESIISMLPEGEVPYSGFEDQASSNGTLTTKISEEVRRMHEMDSFSMGSSDKNGHTTIRREFKNFYHFIKGGNDSMNSVRRETMFINILEGLHPLEADVVCLCKDKKLSDRYKITKEIVGEAYPDITWGNRS